MLRSASDYLLPIHRRKMSDFSMKRILEEEIIISQSETGEKRKRSKAQRKGKNEAHNRMGGIHLFINYYIYSFYHRYQNKSCE